MRRNTVLATVFAMAMTALVGCGGGAESDDGGGGDPLDRTTITGDGERLGGARLTTKRWRILAIRANGNYAPSGADLPCPATATLRADGETTIECAANSFVEFRSDGRSRIFDGAGTGVDFTDVWDFSANVLNITLNQGSSTDFNNANAIDEGIVGGKQRIRLRTIRHEVDRVEQPEDVGNELLVEDAS